MIGHLLVEGVNQTVPVLGGRTVPYVNLDNAASTPAFREVAETVKRFMNWYASVHRGTGFKSRLATRAYDEAHEIVGRFFGADPAANSVIFVRNTTEAINRLANRLALAPHDIVLATFQEHHSNDLPWRRQARVEYVAVDDYGELILDDMEARLRLRDGRVKLVAVTGASNVTGYINPIHEMARLAHRWGAKILIDAAQLAPHRAIDMLPDGDPGHIDFLVASGHKMYAPFGTGVLIGPSQVFRAGEPDLVGGGTVELVTHQTVRWTGLPNKEEAGSPNVPGAIALAKAVQVLTQIGLANVAAHEARLTAYALRRMAEVPDIRLFGLKDPARAGERVGVIPFTLGRVPHGLVAAVLGYEGGIGVRSGCFCAQPYVSRLLRLSPLAVLSHQRALERGDRSQAPGLVRCSFGLYNTEADVDRFIAALETIAAGEYGGEYRLDPANGSYEPEGFTPSTTDYWDWN